jgi:hypothetical protein
MRMAFARKEGVVENRHVSRHLAMGVRFFLNNPLPGRVCNEHVHERQFAAAARGRQDDVQTLVLRRRADYRLQLRGVRVQNKPAVVHALRSYLNICPPFTIETDINSTIAVQQAGPSGLDRRQANPLAA